MVKCLSLKWVIIQMRFMYFSSEATIFGNISSHTFQIWNRNRADIWNTCPVWHQGKKKGIFFCHEMTCTYVMLSSCSTNSISLDLKGLKWPYSLDHRVKIELNSLDLNFHYHHLFLSLIIFPSTDLREFLLRPELGSDERAAQTTRPSHSHFYPGPFCYFLHHIPVCRYLLGHQGPETAHFTVKCG